MRLYLNGGELSNFTIIDAGDFSDSTISNVLWCQSANNRTTIGEWFVPSGTNVSVVDDAGPLHVHYDEGQIGLLRNLGIGNEQGLYRCVIPDENEVNQDLWIAIYRTGTYNDFIAGDGGKIIIINLYYYTLLYHNFSSTHCWQKYTILSRIN